MTLGLDLPEMPAANVVTLLADPHRAFRAYTRLLALGPGAVLSAPWYGPGGDIRRAIPAYRVRMVRYRVLVSGLVQGVAFRATCRRTAERQGVSGWVRNLPDGSVEAVFEGSAESVDALVEWSRHGPRLAEVKEVRVQAEPPEGISGFQIR